MFPGRRRGGRGNLGVVLLGAQVMRMGINNIPPVTLVTVALQVAIYLQLGDLPKWFGHQRSVCMSSYKVWYKGDWKLLILAALTHGDDIHLYYNMASMLWKGRQLEQRFKSVYFAFLLAVFTILSGMAYVALNMAFAFLTDDQSYELTCAVGFSGVLFALKVLVSHYSPRWTQYVMGFIPVPSRMVFWAELVIIQIITPHASFTGHLAGILVGLLYIKGPHKALMDSLVPTELKMKIYFAGSISGGLQDAELYFRIIEQLKAYCTVLTEHVGAKDLEESGEKHMTDKEIHDRDMTWLNDCDVLVAEVTQPSLGVGYEIRRAITLNKKILCMFRPDSGKRLSPMIAGAVNGSSSFVVKNYKEEDVPSILKEFLN